MRYTTEPKTAADIVALKNEWAGREAFTRDPSHRFPIEEARGFNQHREELQAWRVRNGDEAIANVRNAIFTTKAIELGIPGALGLAEHVLKIERDLAEAQHLARHAMLVVREARRDPRLF